MKGKVVQGYRKIRPGGRAFDDVPIHHLVLESFGFPRPAEAQVRHLDGNRLNNALANLKWGTGVENYNDRYAHGTHLLGERNGRARLTWEKVTVIRAMNNPRADQELAAEFGVSKSTICHARLGRTWNRAA